MIYVIFYDLVKIGNTANQGSIMVKRMDLGRGLIVPDARLGSDLSWTNVLGSRSVTDLDKLFWN